VTTRSVARFGQVRPISRWALASRVAARHNGKFRAKRQSAMPSLRRCRVFSAWLKQAAFNGFSSPPSFPSVQKMNFKNLPNFVSLGKPPA
jgi:hypothetical protein